MYGRYAEKKGEDVNLLPKMTSHGRRLLAIADSQMELPFIQIRKEIGTVFELSPMYQLLEAAVHMLFSPNIGSSQQNSQPQYLEVAALPMTYFVSASPPLEIQPYFCSVQRFPTRSHYRKPSIAEPQQLKRTGALIRRLHRVHKPCSTALAEHVSTM